MSPPFFLTAMHNAVLHISFDETDITEPVTPDEAKTWLKLEVDDDDAIVTMLIKAARKACESYTGLSFVQREVTAILRNELGGIRLPYGPVVEITNVYDADGNTLDADGYKIQIGESLTYPTDCAVKLIYNAGFETLPEDLKTGLLMQIVWMYQMRGNSLAQTMSSEAKIILSPYRAIV